MITYAYRDVTNQEIHFNLESTWLANETQTLPLNMKNDYTMIPIC